MADATKKLLIQIDAKDNASRKLNRMGKQTKKTSKLMGGMKTAVGGLVGALGVAGLVGGATLAIKAFASWEQSMANVKTLLGGDEQKARDLQDAMKGMLKTMPVKAEELGAAAYQVLSAGITDTTEATVALEQSVKLAKAGMSTTEEATGLLTVAMNAFKGEGLSTEKISDILFKTVKNGITTVADLSQAFGKQAGNAAAANITLIDMQAATAALTTITGKTSESQNALAQVFLELTQAGGKLASGLEAGGSSLDALNAAIGEEGLVGGMQTIRDEMGLTDTEFKNIFSSAEGGNAVFQLLTSGTEAYEKALEDMNGEVGELDRAYQDSTATLTAWWQLLVNNVTLGVINAGDAIKDATKRSEDQSGAITFLKDEWENWKKQMSETLEIIFGTSDGAVILTGVMTGLIFTVGTFIQISAFFIKIFGFIVEAIYTAVEAVQKLDGALHTFQDTIRNLSGLGKLQDIMQGAPIFGRSESRAGHTGGLFYQHGGFAPRGTDSVPAVLSPGEMVLNRGQQKRMFNMLAGREGEGGGVTEVNFNNVNVRNDQDLETITNKVEETLGRRLELANRGL